MPVSIDIYNFIFIYDMYILLSQNRISFKIFKRNI